MGTKWSSTSISGYNASPPSDDGAQTEANKVKYSTITTNLTDPLNTALTTTLSRLNELLDEEPRAKTGNYTTVSSDNARTIECAGTFTVSLLAAATAGAGYKVTVKNAGTGIITIDPDGSETVDGLGSLALLANDSAVLEVNAAEDGYISHQGRLPRILQIVHATDAGSSHSNTSYTNMNSSVVSITPKSASSKLLIEVAFHGIAGIVAEANTKATFQLYESPSTGIGFEPELEAALTNLGARASGLCCIRHQINSSGTSSRSFGLQGKQTGGATISAVKMVWTITEYLA